MPPGASGRPGDAPDPEGADGHGTRVTAPSPPRAPATALPAHRARAAATGATPSACRALVTVLLLVPLVTAGCTWDSGEATTVRVLVTQDLGATALRDTDVAIEVGWTVMDALMEAAEVETAYGGGFVVAIDGIRSGSSGTQSDWFYEVDGVQAGVGPADWHLRGGETVHWDHRVWRTPGVPPGLWNSFPWQDAQHYHDPALGVADAAGLPATWPDDWPGEADLPVVAHVTPERAPWSQMHGVALEGEALVTAEGRTDGPWALAVRVGPPGTARAVVVHNDHWPGSLPAAGYGWIFTPAGHAVVMP